MKSKLWLPHLSCPQDCKCILDEDIILLALDFKLLAQSPVYNICSMDAC